jgi:N-acetyl-anhydromuramyl-L-alanine amidase AmpD
VEDYHPVHHHRAYGHYQFILRTVMRHIDLIVVHCSATRSNQNFPVTALIRCHAERFGFTGYHYYVTRDGTTYQTRHEQLIGAHAVGFNSHSLGVCYEGGYNERGEPTDTRTKAQKTALLKLLRRLKKAHPDAHILGHRDLPNVHKNCPCFDAQSEYSSLNPRRNTNP